ncbi:MAG: hypothetical protein MRZ79_16560 [Bacteroidia bacterium]|nr:hypothetical protein [Bacteroidia bacterium]
MKKIFLVLLPLAFMFVSCTEFGVPGLSFDYDYEFNIPLNAPFAADSTVEVKIPVSENRLGEELEKRGVQFIEDIELKSVTFLMPDSSKADFAYLKDFSASLFLEGREVPLKFTSQVAEEAAKGGKMIRVKTDPTTPSLSDLMDAENISLLYSMTLGKTLLESTEIQVILNTTVKTAFVE